MTQWRMVYFPQWPLHRVMVITLKFHTTDHLVYKEKVGTVFMTLLKRSNLISQPVIYWACVLLGLQLNGCWMEWERNWSPGTEAVWLKELGSEAAKPGQGRGPWNDGHEGETQRGRPSGESQLCQGPGCDHFRQRGCGSETERTVLDAPSSGFSFVWAAPANCNPLLISILTWPCFHIDSSHLPSPTLPKSTPSTIEA